MEITKEQFNEYKEVQEMGAYNMLSPQARELTTLSKQEWVFIMKNYEQIEKARQIYVDGKK
jgi:hypothetical protein